VKCRPAWNARRAAYLEVVTNSERLITGGAGNQERVPIFIVDSKFDVVSLIAFIPLDLDEPGDGKWLQPRADLRPRATQNEEEGFSDFGAICEKNLRAHLPVGLIPPARSLAVSPPIRDRARK
jgi:hypothetical protein